MKGKGNVKKHGKKVISGLLTLILAAASVTGQTIKIYASDMGSSSNGYRNIIAAGDSYSLAIMTNRSLLAWGDNIAG